VGEGVSADLVNRKVAFGGYGSWSTHTIRDEGQLVLLDDGLDL